MFCNRRDIEGWAAREASAKRVLLCPLVLFRQYQSAGCFKQTQSPCSLLCTLSFFNGIWPVKEEALVTENCSLVFWMALSLWAHTHTPPQASWTFLPAASSMDFFSRFPSSVSWVYLSPYSRSVPIPSNRGTSNLGKGDKMNIHNSRRSMAFTKA